MFETKVKVVHYLKQVRNYMHIIKYMMPERIMGKVYWSWSMHFYPQILFETFFSPVNIKKITSRWEHIYPFTWSAYHYCPFLTEVGQ